MEDYTNNLFKKYKNDVKILKILNKNIVGILDLTKFEDLEELDCSNNKITEYFKCYKLGQFVPN